MDEEDREPALRGILHVRRREGAVLHGSGVERGSAEGNGRARSWENAARFGGAMVDAIAISTAIVRKRIGAVGAGPIDGQIVECRTHSLAADALVGSWPEPNGHASLTVAAD